MIIGISGYAGSGKSTLAQALGYPIRSMAEPVRSIARIITNDPDFGKHKDYFKGKFTGRQLLQIIGTEFGRQMIDSEIWVNLFKENAKGQIVVCDDVRFPNEGAICDLRVSIINQDQDNIMGHVSEMHVDALRADADIVLSRRGANYFVGGQTFKLEEAVRKIKLAVDIKQKRAQHGN
jgi:hypothetical protein